MKYHEEGREKLISGIKKVADIVVSTFGPFGNKVALAANGRQVVADQMSRDGVSVARACQDIFSNPIENMGSRILVHACNKTVSAAGDGTTTTALLVRSLLSGLFDNENEFCRDLKAKAQEAIAAIRDKAFKLSLEQVVSLATIAANNDPVLGKMIGELVFELGADGFIYPVAAEGRPTSVEIKHGYQLDSGPIIPQFFNAKNMNGVTIANGVINLNNPYVLLLEEKVDDWEQFLPILEAYRKAALREDKHGRQFYSQPLLIVAGDISESALRMILVNLLEPQNGQHPVPAFVVKSPESGIRRYDILSDLSAAVGAKLFSRYDGTSVKAFKGAGDFGQCLAAEITQDATRLMLSPAQKEKIDKKVDLIRHKMTLEAADKDFLQARISKLTKGIGIVYIGGFTKAEHIYQQQVVEDAVLAAQSAMREGGVYGGGHTLYETMADLAAKDDWETDAGEALLIAMMAPFEALAESAGIQDMDFKPGYVLNVETAEYEPLETTSIIDSAAVVIEAIQNSVSLACEVIQTKYAISHE